MMKILLLHQPQSFQGNQVTTELSLSSVTDNSGMAAFVSRESGFHCVPFYWPSHHMDDCCMVQRPKHLPVKHTQCPNFMVKISALRQISERQALSIEEGASEQICLYSLNIVHQQLRP